MDSLKVDVGVFSAVASDKYMPLWLISNKSGVFTDQKYDFGGHIKARTTYSLGPENLLQEEKYRFDFGLDVYNTDHLEKFLVKEAYVKLKHNIWQFSAGRFVQVIGEVDNELSSGSLGVSGNSLPIPKISFEIPEYVSVPFTRDFFQFKGQFSHGFMGKNRYLKNAMLHEKNFHVRMGKRKLKLYGGIQHYAVWGGYRAQDGLSLDRSFSGFVNVLFASIKSDGSVPDSIFPNRAGDHRGVIEFGAEWENDKVRIQLNNQTPFDNGQGFTPRNIDRLVSLNFINKNQHAKLKKIVFEFLYTKQMNDFYGPLYRDNYYNNGLYKTGWEYEDNIIGTPLFTNRIRASKYFDDVEPYDWDSETKISGMNNIMNNRVIGLHAGLVFAITPEISSKTMITYTDNYGSIYERDFIPSKQQGYTLQEISWNVPKSQIVFTGSLAVDWGKLSNNFGSMLGVQWKIR